MFYIKQKVWDKILGYAEEAYDTQKSEIGGMSVMVEDNDGDWELQDAVILKQEISAGNTVLEKEALAIYYTKQAMKMKKKNFRFCWWHSHHTMAAFWSGTDLTAIDEFNEGDFSFALVVNLKGEYKFRVSVWHPVEAYQDVDLEIVDPRYRCTKKMSTEVKDLCSKLVHASTYTYAGWNKSGVNKAQLALPIDPDAITVRSFIDILDEVDSYSTELIDGSIEYDIYVKALQDINHSLKLEKSLYKVKIIKRSDIQRLLYMLPADLVVYAATGISVEDEEGWPNSHGYTYGGFD